MYDTISNDSRMEKLKSALVVSLFVLPFLILIAAFPSDYMGWIFLFSSYAILVFVKEMRMNRIVFLTSIVILTLHHFNSFLNAYVGTTLLADADAVAFNYNAGILAYEGSDFQLLVGSGFYTQFLSVIYKLFGVSHFTGEMTSGFSFAITLIVFAKLMRKLEVKKHQGKIMFLFGALPSMILITSVTLRESWEILFFLLSIYSALLLREKKSLLHFLSLTGSVGLLALLHNGLMPFVPLFIGLSLWWSYSKKENQRKSFGKKVSMLIVMVSAVGLWAFLAKGGITSSATDALLSGNLTDYVNDYRGGSKDTRATYGVSMTDSSIFGLMKSLPLMFFFYMFSPLPWQIGNVMDIYAACESILRFILLYYAIKSWRSLQGDERSRHGFLLVAFLSIELLWSLGTSNWGTSMRHHLVGYGLLLLLGAPMMLKKKTKTIKIY